MTKLTKSVVFIVILLCSILHTRAQSLTNPNGVYTLENSQEKLTIASFGTQKVLFFSDGSLFGLKTVGSKFAIGKTLGNTDETIGTLNIQDIGDKTTISIKYNDGKIMLGEKVKLIEKRIEFQNNKLKLVGELILPEGIGPFPVIVQTHGSGEETREASRGMAYLFASNGIASFIFDKRGCGESSGTEWRANFKDYANDLLAAVETVSKIQGVDAEKIGLFGHSQGGWVVPLAYSLKPEKISFCIISAANAVTPVEENLYAGNEELRIKGVDESSLKEVYEFRKIKYEVGISGKGGKEYKNTILPEAEKKTWFKLTGGGLPDNIFWKENGFYDGTAALKVLKCPVLLLYAKYDISTDSKTNLPLMKKLIPSENTTFKLFENANHAMMKVENKDFISKQLPLITQFADGYLDELINWTRKVILEI